MGAATMRDGPGGSDNHRTPPCVTDLAEVSETRLYPRAPPPSGVVEKFAVVFPYDGLFGFGVGRRLELFDAQRTLFATAGHEYVDSHPVEGVGHACLIVRPGDQLLHDVFGAVTPHAHAAFRDLGRPATGGLRLQVQRLRRVSTHAAAALKRDECVVATLHEALSDMPIVAAPASGVIDRARQVLHAFGFERLTLRRIAREVGVSPAYLTQAFTRAEGQPLYRYQLGLRLNRALVELPHSDDLTCLALDLGFSSHSHFTTAFKASFGLSPSAYRAGWRRADH